jgi:histidine triad (HIT) family protein
VFAGMSEGTLFDRIIRREIPSYGVYEDEQVYAFLDIGPQSPGHLLVVPKESRETLAELSDDSAAAVGRALPRICRAVAAATGTPHCNVLLNNGQPAGQAVPHVHFHVIPAYGRRSGPGQGLQTVWRPGSLGAAEGERISAGIRAALADEAAACGP